MRLSDVSVAGAAPMDVADSDEAVPAAKGESSQQAEAKVAALEGKVTALKRVLMAYQRLTSLCVSLEEAPSGGSRKSTLRCTAVNHVHKKALEFQVRWSCVRACVCLFIHE